MRTQHTHARWLLLITCLIMALCLIQRSWLLRDAPVETSPQAQTLSAVSATGASVQQDLTVSGKPCELSAQSLLGAQPLFFDSAIPVLISFLLLLAVFSELRLEIWRDKPDPLPRSRIHLQNCVFHE